MLDAQFSRQLDSAHEKRQICFAVIESDCRVKNKKKIIATATLINFSYLFNPII